MTCRFRSGLLVLAFLGWSVPAVAQHAAQAPSARAEDVASVDAILTALYDVISGPAGQKRVRRCPGAC